jgi:hypothetical protein
VTNHCPFGCRDDQLDAHGYCRHLIGWTEDGRTFELRVNPAQRQPILGTDRIVTTGVSARVYRDWFFA